MNETRKIAAISVADVVGYSRLAGADEIELWRDSVVLRSDLIDPTTRVHHGQHPPGQAHRRRADVIEFRSVVDAVRCAIEQHSHHGSTTRSRARQAASNSASAFTSAMSVEESDGDLDGRRRQHRRAVRGRRRSGRGLPFARTPIVR